MVGALNEIFNRVLRGAKPEDPQYLSRPGGTNEVWSYSLHGVPYIFRFSDRPRSEETFCKEAWCIKQATAARIPGPEVVDIGMADDTAWMIETKIDGICGADWPGEKTAVWRKVGGLAATINSIAVQGYGNRFLPESGGLFRENWQDLLDRRFERLFGENGLVQYGVLNERQGNDACQALQKLYGWKLEPRLSHNDLFLKNTVVSKDEKVHIIDWGDAGGEPAPHAEIANISAWGAHADEIDAFCEGYGLTALDRQAMKADISLLVLLRVLTFSHLSFLDNAPHRFNIAERARGKFDELLGDKPNNFSYLTRLAPLPTLTAPLSPVPAMLLASPTG